MGPETEKMTAGENLVNMDRVWILVENIYQYWFINYNKCSVLTQDINNWGNWVLVYGNSVLLLSQFFYKSKSSQKLQVTSKNKMEEALHFFI